VPAWLTIAALWGVFAATHIGIASARVRPRVVARIGARAYAGVYSLLALAIFVPLVSFYLGHKHAGPLLWHLGGEPILRWAAIVAMCGAFALAAAGLARPSPASIVPGKAEASGVLRITRHPLFMGVGIFGLLHLLVAPIFASDLAFFAGFPLFALVGCHHQDLRKLATDGPEFRAFYEQTSFLPGARGGVFAAVREQPIAMAAGVGVAILIRATHRQLFG
jgi:uncharacterized membrane protein